MPDVNENEPAAHGSGETTGRAAGEILNDHRPPDDEPVDRPSSDRPSSR